MVFFFEIHFLALYSSPLKLLLLLSNETKWHSTNFLSALPKVSFTILSRMFARVQKISISIIGYGSKFLIPYAYEIKQ